MSRGSRVTGMVTTSARTLITKETKPVTTAIPVSEPVIPIIEGIRIVSTAFEDQSRSPFLRATQSWNLVPPTQNVTLPQFTNEPNSGNSTRNGRIPRVSPKDATKVNGLLVGGVVLGILLLLGVVWYSHHKIQKRRYSPKGDDANPRDQGFLRKLWLSIGLSQNKSACYSLSDLESVSNLGENLHQPKFDDESFTPTPLPEDKSEKKWRPWKDTASWKLLPPPRVKLEGRPHGKEDESDETMGRQPPSIQNRGRIPGLPPSIGSSRNGAPLNTSTKGYIRSQWLEAPETQSRTIGRRGSFDGGSARSGRSRGMPLETIRESSPHPQQSIQRSSDSSGGDKGYNGALPAPATAFLRPDQQGRRPGRGRDFRPNSSAYSGQSPDDSSEDSADLESCLGVADDRNERKGRLSAPNIPGTAF